MPISLGRHRLTADFDIAQTPSCTIVTKCRMDAYVYVRAREDTLGDMERIYNMGDVLQRQ